MISKANRARAAKLFWLSIAVGSVIAASVEKGTYQLTNAAEVNASGLTAAELACLAKLEVNPKSAGSSTFQVKGSAAGCSTFEITESASGAITAQNIQLVPSGGTTFTSVSGSYTPTTNGTSTTTNKPPAPTGSTNGTKTTSSRAPSATPGAGGDQTSALRRTIGSNCTLPADCNSGNCVGTAPNKTCAPTTFGMACVDPSDCLSRSCAATGNADVPFKCEKGTFNATCATGADCLSNSCLGKLCAGGAVNALCTADSDCKQGICAYAGTGTAAPTLGLGQVDVAERKKTCGPGPVGTKCSSSTAAQSCFSGSCTLTNNTQCAAATYTQGSKKQCYTDSDCKTGTCNLAPNTDARFCGPAPAEAPCPTVSEESIYCLSGICSADKVCSPYPEGTAFVGAAEDPAGESPPLRCRDNRDCADMGGSCIMVDWNDYQCQPGGVGAKCSNAGTTAAADESCVTNSCKELACEPATLDAEDACWNNADCAEGACLRPTASDEAPRANKLPGSCSAGPALYTVCTNDNQCISGVCGPETNGKQVCERGDLNAACLTWEDCKSNNCDASKCVPGGFNTPCASDEECASEKCDLDNQVCQKGAFESPCLVNEDCQGGRCHNTDPLVNAAGDEQPTTTPIDEVDGLSPPDRQCLLGFTGGSCEIITDDDADPASGYDCISAACSSTGVCQGSKIAGTCAVDKDCSVGFCDNGEDGTFTCLGQPGDTCETAAPTGSTECFSGVCLPSTNGATLFKCRKGGFETTCKAGSDCLSATCTIPEDEIHGTCKLGVLASQCRANADCPLTAVGATGNCKAPATKAIVAGDDETAEVIGTCQKGSFDSVCVANGDCLSNICTAAKCAKGGIGATCIAAADCTSGSCPSTGKCVAGARKMFRRAPADMTLNLNTGSKVIPAKYTWQSSETPGLAPSSAFSFKGTISFLIGAVMAAVGFAWAL